jgi:dTDP-4-dehydrorhamnose reductase
MAALANGMSAHADETDDSHLRGRFHPGCAVVPAALAAAEAAGRDGPALLRAVALGYDVCARLTMSLNAYEFREDGHSTHSFGPMFGAAAAAGALAIQISTDYSFDGTATEPYTESSPTKAIGAYGRTKLAGELAVAEAATPDFAIVRSSWLFGPHGKNFVDTILRAGAERGELKVVHDQVGCPTYTGHLAQALVDIAVRRLTGILHVAGGGSCSWYELAVAALEAAGVECTVTKTTAAEFGRPAPRPAYSVLVSERDDAPRLPPWQDGLAAHLSATRALT